MLDLAAELQLDPLLRTRLPVGRAMRTLESMRFEGRGPEPVLGTKGPGAIALAIPQPAVAVPELVWPLLVALSTAAAIAPFWVAELLPFQDAPQHIAAVRVLADYHTPGLEFEKWFELDLGRLQYLGFYLPAAALAKLVGPVAAVRLMLSLIAAATSAAFWMFLGTFGRDRRLAVFAPALLHTMPLYLGFFNFVESIPVALVVVALAERELSAPSPRRAVLLALAASVLLWLHPSGLAFALAAAVVLAVTSGEPRRRMARMLAPLIPAVLLFVAWALQALATRDGPGTAARTPAHWLGLRGQLYELARFGNVLAEHADELYAVALGALFIGLVAVRGRPTLDRSFRLPLLAGLTLAAYLLAPFDMGYMGYIHTRAMPFLVLLVIASPLIAPGRKTGAILVSVVALQIAYDARIAAAYRAFDREAQASELRQVLQAAKPGKRLIAIADETQSRIVQYQAYLHFAAYYEVLRGGRARYNFAETPWTPVRFSKGTEPVPLPRTWDSKRLEQDVTRAVSDEDYVLVRKQGPQPRGFEVVARAGVWSLYAPVAPR